MLLYGLKHKRSTRRPIPPMVHVRPYIRHVQRIAFNHVQLCNKRALSSTFSYRNTENGSHIEDELEKKKKSVVGEDIRHAMRHMPQPGKFFFFCFFFFLFFCFSVCFLFCFILIWFFFRKLTLTKSCSCNFKVQ